MFTTGTEEDKSLFRQLFQTNYPLKITEFQSVPSYQLNF